jgi:hypothetical protein
VCFVFTTSFDRTQSRPIMRTPHCLDIGLWFFFSFFSSLLFLLIFIPIIPNDFRPYRVPSPLLLFLLAYPAAFFLQSPLLITSDAGGLSRLNSANKSNETTCQQSNALLREMRMTPRSPPNTQPHHTLDPPRRTNSL